MHTDLVDGSGMVGLAPRVRLLQQATNSAPLTTIIGPAGVGKTSLAKAWLQTHEDTLFVDLCSATTEHDIVERIAAVVGLHLSNYDDDDAATAVGRVLQGRHAVLDNLEQVIAPASALLTGWLNDGVQGLVCTSREPLRIPGELTHELHTLSADDAAALLSRLAGLPITEGVVDLVAALDHLPLAIHLAAPLCSVISPAALAERVLSRPAPGSNRRGADPRHRSMEAALESCWVRLSEVEQQTLSALSLFESEFSLEAAEAVLGPSNADALSLLVGLKDKSLLQSSATDGVPLLRMMVSTRHFVRQQLEPTPQDQLRLRAYLALAGERADRQLLGGQAQGRQVLRRHWPDVRAIVRQSADADLLARWRKYLSTTTPRRRWTLLYEQVLADTVQTPTQQILLLRSSYVGGCLHLYGAERALAEAQLMLKQAAERDFDQAVGVAKSVICECYCRLGRLPEAQRVIKEALDILTEPLATAIAYRRLAWVQHQLGEPSDQASETAESLYRQHNLTLLLAPLLAQRGLTDPSPERSEAHLSEAESLALAYDGTPGWLWGVVHSYGTLTGLCFADWGRAAAHAAAFQRSASASADTSVAALGVAARILLAHSMGQPASTTDVQLADRLANAAAASYRIYTRAALMVHALSEWNLDLARTHAQHLVDCEENPQISHVGASYLALIEHTQTGAKPTPEAPPQEDELGVGRVVQELIADERPLLDGVPLNKRFWSAIAIMAEAAATAVHVGHDGSWVRSIHGDHDLSSRPVPRRILQALIHTHLRSAGEPIDAKALIQSGWPNERMKASAAMNRLYTQIRVLRSDGGLGEGLKSGGGGYLLDARRVRIVTV